MEKYFNLYLCYKRGEMVLSREKPDYVCPTWVWEEDYKGSEIDVGFLNIFCKMVDGSVIITAIPFLLYRGSGEQILTNLHEEMEHIKTQVTKISNPDLSYRIISTLGHEFDMICLGDILPSDCSCYDVAGYEIKKLRVAETLSLT